MSFDDILLGIVIFLLIGGLGFIKLCKKVGNSEQGSALAKALLGKWLK